MPRYKDYNYDQTKLLPVSFDKQILPGTIEYTLSYLIEHEFDLSPFEARYCNDDTGAPAYDPAILLKIILYAYSRGVVTSRDIERMCRENVVMMALSADTCPHYTTIADFVSSSGDEISRLFRDVLLVCDEAGLIGREMFAVDGCKLRTNASKEWSGTRADFERKVAKMERGVRHLLKRHRELDEQARQSDPVKREKRQIKTLRAKVGKIKGWLAEHEDKPGKRGKPKQSNITDNDSAKMKTSHGVIQGYDGVAAVDAKRQVVIHAEAFGEAQEHDLLRPMIDGIRANFRAIGSKGDVFAQAKVTSDSGFHTEANVRALFETGIDGYIADTGFRKRDPRFAEADRYKTRHRREQRERRLKAGGQFTNKDFYYDPEQRLCICPAGKKLYSSGAKVVIGSYWVARFKAPKGACRDCECRARCLRYPDRTEVRQVAFFGDAVAGKPETFTARMKRKIDSVKGRAIYGRRLGTVEPVFGNITSMKRLNRFTLRGKAKVNTQWLLYCIVHNIGKVHRFGPGFT